MQDVPDDVTLIARIVEGDQRALAELYERYGKYLFNVGFRVLRDRCETEDLLHDVFLEAWRTARSFEPARGDVRTWLALRMRSRAIDRVKSARWRGATSVEVDTLASAAPPATIDRTLVRRSVRDLDHERGTLLSLAFTAGLTMRELARHFGIPVGTVKSRLATSLAHVRRGLWQSTPT
jgi:RNA polymerase sigma-70 factor, ECF subfamily